MGHPARRIGGLHGDGPGPASRLGATGAHFPVDADKRRGDAEIGQGFGQAIDAVAFRNAVQIEGERAVLASAIAIELE